MKRITVSIFVFVFAAGCSHQTTKHEESTTLAVTAPVATSVADTASHETESAQMTAKAAADSTASAQKAAHSAPHKSHRTPGPVPAEQALKWLKNGNIRYTTGHLRKDGQQKSDIARLSAGQKPHTIVLSCSDSRVPPEIIFDQKLGEIFVIRTAGPNLDPAVIASVEYAVEHLGSNLILIQGHTSCGAVKAALATMDGADAGSPALNHLVAAMHPRLKPLASHGTHSVDYRDESWANVNGVSAELIAQSDIIREAANSGSLEIHTGVYDLTSGKVEIK